MTPDDDSVARARVRLAAEELGGSVPAWPSTRRRPRMTPLVAALAVALAAGLAGLVLHGASGSRPGSPAGVGTGTMTPSAAPTPATTNTATPGAPTPTSWPVSRYSAGSTVSARPPLAPFRDYGNESMNTFRSAFADWTGRVVGTFEVQSPMASGTVSPDGSLILSGSTIYAADGHVVGDVGVSTWGESVMFAADSSAVCDAWDPGLAGTTTLRLLRAGRPPQVLRTLPGDWAVVACGPESGRAVVGHYDPSSSGIPGFLEVAGISMASGEPEFAFPYPARAVTTLAVSLDGSVLAEGGWPDGVRLRALPGGAALGVVASPHASAIALSADGSRVAIDPAQGDTAEVVAWRSGAVLFSGRLDQAVPRPGSPELLLVEPDVRLALLDPAGAIRQTWP